MASRFLSNTVKATHGAAQVEGLLTVRENYRPLYKVKTGDGKQAVRDHVADELTLSLTFSNDAAASDFAAAGEANLVIRADEFGGGQVDVTYKNVAVDSGDKSVPTRQDTAIGTVTINATATFGDADTYATMVTVAPAT
jgi:hypothetical protein